MEKSSAALSGGRAFLDQFGEFLVALGVMLDDALVAGKEDDLVVVVVFWGSGKLRTVKSA